MRIPLFVVVLGALSLVGCAHKSPAPPKTPKAPVVLKADDQHAKVVFRVATTHAIATFHAGKPGDLERVGNVYNDAEEQQYPGFTRGLAKGLTRAFGFARPVREILVPAGETTEVESTGGWTESTPLRQWSYSCGPFTNQWVAQANKTYLVEFDRSGMLCSQALYDITDTGQKVLIPKGAR
ncbi:hypothetical protein [Pseudomonas sp. NPDC088444]|uniref:hypothetical protein n=1 Tax=Pseudomonas sp. NPDC088444 TaxID=3364456 RepID=UPI003850BC75